MHSWGVMFLTAHGGEMNPDKTFYTISNTLPNDPRWLPLCEAKIVPKPSNTYFRYLGIQLNIIMWALKTKEAGLCSLKILDTYKTLLLPKLDLGLSFTTISNKKLKSWNRLIIKTIIKGDRPAYFGTKLSDSAFSEIAKCNLPFERYWKNQLKELLYNMSSTVTVAGQTTLARLHHITGLDQRISCHLQQMSLKRKQPPNRYTHLLRYFYNHKVTIISPAPHIGDVYKLVMSITSKIKMMSKINIYTDGSTIQGNLKSGVGIYITGDEPNSDLNSCRFNFALHTQGG